MIWHTILSMLLLAICISPFLLLVKFWSFAHFKLGCLFSYWDLNGFFKWFFSWIKRVIHVFMYSATMAETAFPFFFTDRSLALLQIRSWLKILSISGSLTFGDHQCDMGLANKKQAEGAVCCFPERPLKGKTQLARTSLIFCPLPILLPFSRMWYNAQRRSAHVLRRKTKSQVKDSRANDLREPDVHWHQGDIAEVPGLSLDFSFCDKKHTSCLVIWNTP